MNNLSKIFAVALLATATSAFANTYDPYVNARQARQDARIDAGVATGQLTVREARFLRAEERMVRAEERAFKADGYLSPVERAVLHRDLNRVGRDAYRLKHNNRVRPLV